jgi:hypothetical protein
MTIYIILGPTGAGKSTTMEHLGSKGMLTVESSKYCEPFRKRYDMPTFLSAVQLVGQASTGFELSSQLEQDITENGELKAKNIAISGFRLPWQVDFFQGRYKQVQLIGLYATPELCFEQYQKREGKGKYANVDDFVQRKLKPDYDILDMGKTFDMVPKNRWIIVNGDKDYLLRSVDKLVNQ